MKNDDSLIERMRKTFVPYEIFNLRLSPIEKIVYTGVSVAGVAIVGAIMTLILRKPNV